MAKKILVIEDDKFLSKVINKKLLQEGYEVIEALDGKEGIKAAKDSKPDLILLDLVLPMTNGFEVLAKLKKNPVLSKIPVIILSNLGGDDDIKKGIEMGAVDYLIKAHFDLDEIIIRMELVFKKKK